MSPDGTSNIRVFIRWHEQTVFAGEEVKCTITFKNVAPSPGPPRQGQTERNRLISPLHGRPKTNHGLTPPPSASAGRGGHRRSALSLSVPSSQLHSPRDSIQWPPSTSHSERQSQPPPTSQPPQAGHGPAHGHKHKRSISIVSMGTLNSLEDSSQRNEQSGPPRTQRPTRGHARASSLQIVSHGQNRPPPGPRSGTF